MRVCLLSLGCKVNQAEINDLRNAVLSRGHEVVELHGQPELCIINTCTVTARSDYESRQLARRAARTGARVILTGCYAEMNQAAAREIPGVETVVTNHDKSQLISLIPSSNKSNTLTITGPGSGRSRYTLKVQDGCDNSCAYCLVWKARGRSRSIDPAQAARMAAEAEVAGYREIVLTGVHLGAYGADIANKTTLFELLGAILVSTRNARIRLSSIEASEVTDDLIRLMADEPRICRHLHVPLQSGDSDVLRAMNRSYDAAEFEGKISKISSRLNGIALGTDIIAGFPSESDAAFENSCAMLDALPFTYAHVFQYSPRRATVAAAMNNLLTKDEIRERARILREIAARKKAMYMQAQAGRELEVLVEDAKSSGHVIGTTDNYLKIQVVGACAEKGSLVRARVSGVAGGMLVGNPLRNS